MGQLRDGTPLLPSFPSPSPAPPFSKGSLGINVNSWIVPAGIAIRDGEDDGGCWRWSPPHNLPSSSPPPAPPPSSIYPPPSPRILPLFWEIYLDERISLSLSLALSSRAHHPFSWWLFSDQKQPALPRRPDAGAKHHPSLLGWPLPSSHRFCLS